ncbi:MAG: peptidase M23 [Flavobacteriaceae bacterium]|nr:peptidase M23 [Flavobacteriaceae bacterium]|tara:strand:- start:1539 stop:2414 length:876 start_codon:yes stop_codon:yes gene_type:complete
MANKKNNNRTWLQNLLNRYRMIVINETTFNEELSFRFSRLNILSIIILLLVFIFTGTFFLVSYTPIKEFIPGYTSTKVRKEAIRNTFLLDSLVTKFQKQDQFIKSIKSALSGKNESDEGLLKEINKSNLEPFNREFNRVKADSLLRLEVMQEDKYNLMPNSKNNVKFMLFSPASGLISEPFNSEIKHFAVDIALAKDTPIKSVAVGTVVLAEWTSDTGYVIVIKHNHGLLSVYKHNSTIEKSQGDIVQAGEVIAFAGNSGELSTGYHLHFELWIDGYPVDPTNFIDFSQGL